jgi:hypothetical protein
VEEVDDLAVAQPVQQVARRSPEDQAEREGGEAIPGGETAEEGTCEPARGSPRRARRQRPDCGRASDRRSPPAPAPGPRS